MGKAIIAKLTISIKKITYCKTLPIIRGVLNRMRYTNKLSNNR